MSEVKPITVHIMGNEYHVSSPEDQTEQLETAARELDRRMREIKSGGRIVGIERIAVMAALNLSYELLQSSQVDSESAEKIESKINQLVQDIDSVLASDAQLELT
ncbi:cell division protein ZapA [Aliikangiella marina]|uniref:Cell division protein ZapA n=1 Tax=Aliikangiella marina TaxID=1712262 RepID=A0A545T1B7_9GAMM|nr:cell division protein ZapA [Aliikangiella marina]TQV71016.1 cell division protein ZapA [Aliikangiella marina]